MKWCGEDALFCSWGNSDLLELQRNMKYYGILQLLKGPIRYLDVQKLFSIDREDGDSRRSLEYAVDVLEIEKQQEFHRALADSWYTAKVLMQLRSEIVDTFYSIDCYQNPKRSKSFIRGMKNLFPGNLTPKKKPWRIRRSPAAAVICAEKISAKRSGGLRRGRRIITAWRTVRYMAG